MSGQNQTTAIPVAPRAEQHVTIESLLTYQRTVFLICLGFTRNDWDAQELTQETYLQAFERLHQLRDPEAGKAWLCRLSRNLCLDHLRKQRWRKWLGLDEVAEQSHNQNPEVLLQNQDQLHSLKSAVGQLPAKYREVFVLRAYGELSYEEIAGTLSIQLGTIMSRLSRARAIIKKELEKGGAYEQANG
jgi:RNA polymerase sigma-70 factor (ECF subfamily)